ncbi:DUF1653 domain-containing protein [Clostridiaceae bacterium AF29-16BH]|nr:DUF1653 domain-containing protein [Clostridiaceae bacterium AF31-3BH]RHQ27386.1 DUF1653 domain-containing protein [Clostridiaceae bacterium AF29-16BH]
MREIRQGQFYRHFKGGLYQVMAIATHSETKEKMVVYQALYGDYGIYVRPYDMFASEVDHEKYPQVKQVYRFTQVHPEEMEEESDKVEVPDLTLELDESMEPEQSAVEEEPKKMSEDQPAQEKQDVSGGINPILLEFLDADTLEEKMHIMTFYRNQMDEALLNSIAISLDLVVDKKGLRETYDEIMNCLSMMKHFECTNRFR